MHGDPPMIPWPSLHTGCAHACVSQVQLVQLPQHLSEDVARGITCRIKACANIPQLYAVCQRHGRAFNHIHVSAAITHVAQLHCAMRSRQGAGSEAGPDPSSPSPDPDELPSTSYSGSGPPAARPLSGGAGQLLGRLLYASTSHMAAFEARQLSNMLWSVAKCGYSPHPSWMKLVLAAAGRQWGRYDAQHVANIAYALALMRHDPGKEWLEALKRVRAVAILKHAELSPGPNWTDSPSYSRSSAGLQLG